MTIHTTILFIGVFALIQVPLTVMVGYRRVQTNIQFLDGGDQTLLRRMRAHANYTENVPIVLLAMAAAEHAQAPQWLLWAGGVSLLVGRLMHAAVLILRGWGLPRALGMILTFLPMLTFGGWCVAQAFR
ncbi:hypothetical protein AZ34_05490 [Hylemonella gracilis str. Niagara R]|uniref:MAPEG family protein n=1 Tax=Hylemonella gracilis str. Niagara R TaxID=1458275 RepID=A0A016XES7_9BURK|nr:MAPEG family protein [Hylemonella gracilis]EYC50569.1 hypothetical protein AZ34_05490 [Hylemonella gracilis str. Niagara R]